MPVDKAKQYARNSAWNQSHTTLINLRFVRTTEADLLAHLNAQPNKSGYIKSLIRADMERTRGETTQKEDE